MIALLRVQALVAARFASGMVRLLWGAFLLVATFLILPRSLGTSGGFAASIDTVAAVLLGGAVLFLVASTMAAILHVLNGLRFATPVTSRSVLSAYLAFSTAASAIVACLVAWIGARSVAEGLLQFGECVAVGLACAAIGLVLVRPGRWTFVNGSIAVALLLLVATAATFAIAVARTSQTAVGAALLGLAVTIALVVGSASFLRAELLPSEQVPTGRPKVFARESPMERAVPRSPVGSIRGATWSRSVFVLLIAFAVMQMSTNAPETGLWFVLLYASIATNMSLFSWNWLIATPIDRRRAFRILFLPALGLAAAAATFGAAYREIGEGDRTAFFHGHDSRFSPGHPRPLVLGDFLASDRTDRTWRVPEPAQMAESVRSHLERDYGLRVPAARIEASIRRDWPYSLGAAWDVSAQEAVFDSMDRVRADLEEELLAADRTPSVLCGVAAVLLTLFWIRFRVSKLRRQALLFAGVMVLAWVVAFAPKSGPDSTVANALSSARAMVVTALVEAGTPTRVFLLLASTGAAWILWRSAERAFRRLEWTDLSSASAASR